MMYETFYGLREPPFHVTADPAFFFPAPQYRDAFDHLTYGIRHRLGFLELTGKVGSGKTTLVNTWVNQLDASACTSVIVNPHLSDTQLLDAIVHDFGADPQGHTRSALMTALNQFLLDQQRCGRTAVLIIDEAQVLSSRTLEQIRLLSNLETAKEKLLQIILVGQPELSIKLATPSLRPLHQRIAVRYRIAPMTTVQVGDYIIHRLTTAGARPARPAFTPAAVSAVAAYSRGLPRTINRVCDHALLAGFTRDVMTIDVPLIRHAICTLEGREDTREDNTHEHHYRRLAESPATSPC